MTPLSKIAASLDQGWSPKCLETASSDAADWAVIKTTAIQQLRFEVAENKQLPPDLTPRPHLQIQGGDILITRAGPRSRVGICCYVSACRPRLLLCDKAYRLRVREDMADARYVAWMLNGQEIVEQIEAMKSGISDSGLNLKQEAFLALTIPLPPLAEQRRIVARIEALFARTRRARTDLERIASLSERLWYNALSASFSGDAADHMTTLGELVVEGPQNGYSPATNAESKGTLALRLTATTSGKLDLSPKAVKRLSEVIPPGSRYWLRPGDLLIQRANALEHIGAAAIYQGPSDTYIYPDLMMRVRLSSLHLTEYLWRFLNSPSARQRLREQATGTAGNMPKINSATVRSLPVPMVTPDRLLAVVRSLAVTEQSQSIIRREATRARALLDRLEQSILTRAFRGELVSQDPADEPARLSPTPIASHPRRRRAAPSAAIL